MVRTEPESFEAQLLAGAAQRFTYPPTPDLRARTVARVAALGRPSGNRLLRPRVALVAVVVVLGIVGLLLALPPGRHAVAEFFGLVQGERIERLAPTSTPSAAPTGAGHLDATPTVAQPSPVRPSDYARSVTLDEARTTLGFEPALPLGEARPVGIYLAVWGQQPLLILEYPNFDLWQTRGGGFVGKGLPEDAQVETPSVSGEAAYWVDSGPYDFAFYDAGGTRCRARGAPSPARC